VYSLVRQLDSRRVAVTEIPALAGSLVIAEACYKFHSFSLECAAFLVTWLALSWLTDLGARAFGRGVPE
jgi:hypothetical protein